MSDKRILVIGSNGQIGSVLLPALRELHGVENVFGSDLKGGDPELDPQYRRLDATDRVGLDTIVKTEGITEIYLLAAILSARGEQNPLGTWDINMTCLFNCLEVARENGIKKVFYPSTIAVFGSDTPRVMTPQETNRTPATVYGMSKLTGELWASYYHERYGLDIRSVRYPGIIGYQSLPGGGTTDYAVDIFHQALKQGSYSCFLEAGTRLPMMYMDDAIRATIELMEAPADQIKVRTSYNLSAFSFSPEELAAEIVKHIPDFTISYAPDFRQKIAASWSESIDDSAARADWGWKPRYDLASMTADILHQLKLMKS
jgi:threonine 3-dehydrogenase